MTQMVKLFQSFVWSYYGLLNVLLLYLLSIFLFALLGCFIYKDIQFEEYKSSFSSVTRFFNFDEFYKAFTLIFLSSYDSFEVFMLEYMYTKPTRLNIFITIAFFISYFFICFILMLNLFLLIIIMQYDEFYKKKENPMDKFENIFRFFNKYWSQFIEKDCPMRIQSKKLKYLLETLEANGPRENIGKDELKVLSTKLFIFDLKLLE